MNRQTENCDYDGKPNAARLMYLNPLKTYMPDGEVRVCEDCRDRFLYRATGNAVGDGVSEFICKAFRLPMYVDREGITWFPVPEGR